MKNSNIEAPEKSTSKSSESHGETRSESHVVTEALSLLSSSNLKIVDNTVNYLSKKASQFLDMGDSVSLYGKSAVEPTSEATPDQRKKQNVHQDKTTKNDKNDSHDKNTKNDRNGGHDQQGRNEKQSRSEKQDRHDKQDRQSVTKPLDKKASAEQKPKGTEGTTKETQSVIPDQPVRMPHPDRLEEMSKTQPEAVEKLRESEKNYEHKKLEDWANKSLQEPERSKFKKDMTTFEERAKKDGLAHADVAVTYREIQRLTNATGETPLTSLERNHLAQQVLHQAAIPTSIDQGQYNTCNITTVEARCYTRTPAQAARLVADVALTGEYRSTHDGTVVKQDPKAHTQSKIWPTPDGSRSHASEIFQVTATNLYYVKHNAVNGTNLRYEQIDPPASDKADNGERLWDGNKEMSDGNGGVVRNPYLSEGRLTVISNEISARPEDDVTLASAKWYSGTADNVTKIASQEELSTKLKYLKEHGQLPVIVRVNTTAEPFYTDSGQGAAGGSGGAHVVTITDFDEKNNTVTLDNQWGTYADHGKEKPVSIKDLYTAMQSNQGIEAELQKDVTADRANNIVDSAKEVQLLRLQKLNGMPDAEYVKQLNTLIENKHKSWEGGNVSAEQKAKDRSDLRGLIGNAPAKDQIEMIRKEKQLGMISYEDYRTQLTWAGVKVEKDFSKAPKPTSEVAPGTPDPVKDHENAIKVLNTALADLTEGDQKWVRDNIVAMAK